MWKQRPPTHLLSVTRERQSDSLSHQEHFHLCCGQKLWENVSSLLLPLAFPPKSCVELHIFALQKYCFSKSRKHYTLCVCVCVFLFPCVCLNESSRSDPTLCGRLIWRAGSIWPLSVWLSQKGAAHITGLFVPNVTRLKGREVIPSIPLVVFTLAPLCLFVPPDPCKPTAGDTCGKVN